MQFIGAVSLINDQEFGSIDKAMQHSLMTEQFTFWMF